MANDDANGSPQTCPNDSQAARASLRASTRGAYQCHHSRAAQRDANASPTPAVLMRALAAAPSSPCPNDGCGFRLRYRPVGTIRRTKAAGKLPTAREEG